MVVTVGKVVDGKVVVEGEPLPEGKTVGVLLSEDDSEGFELSPEDEAEILDRIKHADSGDAVDGDRHLQKLRSGL